MKKQRNKNENDNNIMTVKNKMNFQTNKTQVFYIIIIKVGFFSMIKTWKYFRCWKKKEFVIDL